MSISVSVGTIMNAGKPRAAQKNFSAAARRARLSYILPVPGEPRGPLDLPASYTQAQLIEYGWDGVEFKSPPSGGWGSKLNDARWKDSGPRSRVWSLLEAAKC